MDNKASLILASQTVADAPGIPPHLQRMADRIFAKIHSSPVGRDLLMDILGKRTAGAISDEIAWLEIRYLVSMIEKESSR